MSIVPPNRNNSITTPNGKQSILFASVIESIIGTVNALAARPVNAQETDYTFLISDALKIVRKTDSESNQTYTIPANTAVPFEIGTVLKIQNDGSVAMKIAINTDTLTSESGLGTGIRTIAAAGSAIITKVAATQWKIRGEQLT